MKSRNKQRPLYDAGFSIFDTVLDKISDTVGSKPVETGGALIGDYTSSVVNDFVFDDDAETTAVSYIPSRRLVERINALEHAQRLQFKGVLHSHPGNFDSPSGPDANSFFEGLHANPELPRYLAPIVTFQDGEQRDNKIRLRQGGWVTFYVALREGDRSVRIERTMPDIIHFGRDCRSISMLLGIKDPEFINGHNGNSPTVTAVIQLTENFELILTADGTYPDNAPQALLYNKTRDETSQIETLWKATVPSELRLLHAFADSRLMGDDFPTSLAYGLNHVAITSDEQRATELNLQPILVGADFSETVEKIETGLFARSKGLLSETLRNCTVLVNGAGSVGSYMAEQLVRSGVGSITLIDPDIVEYANLSRTNYVASDVGTLKIDALAKRLLQISPSLKTQGLPINLHDLSDEQLSDAFTTADIVICAVDDRRAQLLINRWAYANNKPAIYVGIFAGAKSGEVCWVDPPLPCYQCATQFRGEFIPGADTATDYGTGRLVAEVALGIDIQAVTTIGIRLALSSLVRGQESSLASYVSELGKKQYVVFAVDPKDEHISPYFDPSMAGQYGHKSLWMNPSQDKDCNVCGDNRDTPRATVNLSVDDIMKAMEADTTEDVLAPQVMTEEWPPPIAPE